MTRRRFALAAGFSLFAVMNGADASAQNVTAKQAILIEHPGGKALLSRNADQPMSPSSMTKIMTAFLVFEALESRRVTAGDSVAVSARAADAKGATMDLKAGDRVPLSDLLRGMIVASANDAAVALAEHIAGSEREFAQRMTARAKQIGLGTASFANATGHAADRHRMTAAEVAALTALLIDRFPEGYKIFAERSFAFRGRSYDNRNPALGRIAGADGVKTGQTAQGGYGLAASALRDGRRLILVINGMPNEAARAAEAARLLEWGFQQPRR